MFKVKAALGSLFFLLLVSSPATPQVFQWKGKDGNWVFSDTPPAEKVKGVKVRPAVPPREERGAHGEMSAKTSPPPASPGKGKRAYRDVEAAIYMADGCPVSIQARDYLKSLGVKLAEYNVEKERDRNEELLRITGGRREVPVIDIEGILLKGFSRDKIKMAVEKRID